MTGRDSVIRVTNTAFSSNTYLVRSDTRGECILIDPGLDRDAIERALDDAGLVPTAVFCTHGHFDHIGSAEHFRRKYGVALHLHGADAKIARSSNFLMMAFKLETRIDIPTDFVALEHGFKWSNGSDWVEVIHAPGHTPGSTILVVNGRAFTGDTIYRSDVWLTKLPDLNREQLAASVRQLWDVLPDSTEVYPGHGGSSAFGQIKRSNVPLREMLGLAAAVSHD